MSSTNTENGAIARFGYVSAYDAQRHMARIQFPDKENLVLSWLPVVIPNSKKNHDELHLDIKEHVVCLMLGNGLEAGVVIGAVYDDENKPPTGDQDTRKITFNDGTEISYDRKNHKLVISCVGDIEIITPGNINVTSGSNITNIAARIDLN